MGVGNEKEGKGGGGGGGKTSFNRVDHSGLQTSSLVGSPSSSIQMAKVNFAITK